MTTRIPTIQVTSYNKEEDTNRKEMSDDTEYGGGCWSVTQQQQQQVHNLVVDELPSQFHKVKEKWDDVAQTTTQHWNELSENSAQRWNEGLQTAGRQWKESIERWNQYRQSLQHKTWTQMGHCYESASNTATAWIKKTQAWLAQIGSLPWTDDNHTVKGIETDGWIVRVPVALVETLAVVGWVSALYSLIEVMSHVVDLTAFLWMILAPLLLWQRQQLLPLGTLRTRHEHLCQQKQVYSVENRHLQARITDYQRQQPLQGSWSKVENRLRASAVQSQTTVYELVQLAEECQSVQAQLQQALQAQVLQEIWQTLVLFDMAIPQEELVALCQRLQQMPGVELQMVVSPYWTTTTRDGTWTLAQFRALARHLQDDDTSPDQKAIRLDPMALVK